MSTPKIFQVTDDEFVAARSADEARDHFLSLHAGDEHPEMDVREITLEEMEDIPTEYEAGGEIKTRPMAEMFRLSVAEGMVVPCIFASSDWR